jgi:hypothetical protein
MESRAEFDEMNSAEEENVMRAPVVTKSEIRRLKFKRVAEFVMDALAPLIAVIAVVIAVIALNAARSNRTEFGQNSSTLEHLNANLKAAKAEVEKLKLTILQEKMTQTQLLIKQDEQTRLIVQQVSKLQEKLKISPTLEVQMLQVVSTVNVSHPLTTATIATEPAKNATPQGQNLKGTVDKLNKK